LIIIRIKCAIDRFDHKEGFTKSQKGPRKFSMELGRDNSEGYSQHNQPVREKKRDPNTLHGIEQQERRGRT
jgi:hypothetical protein